MEGLQEPYVAGVGVPHQIEHRVRDRHPAVVRGQHPVGPGGDVGGDRGDARRVQDGQVAEPAGRPADLDPVHVGRGQLAQVDLERPALPVPRPGHRGAAERMHHHLRSLTLGVPGQRSWCTRPRPSAPAPRRAARSAASTCPPSPCPRWPAGGGRAAGTGPRSGARVRRRRSLPPPRGPAVPRSTRPGPQPRCAHQLPSGRPHPVRGGGPRPPAACSAGERALCVEPAGPPGGLQRLPGRAVEQHRPALEVVPQLPLGAAQPVPGLLVHDERDLVDEAADGRLGLLLPVGPLPLALVGDDLAADAGAEAERDARDRQDGPRCRPRRAAAAATLPSMIGT